MSLTSTEADKLNKSDPVRQDTELGTEILNQQTVDSNTPRIVRFAVAADATSGLSITIPYNMIVSDVWVECTTANAGGTLTLRKSTTAVTDAMVCAVDKTVVRAGTIDDAQSTILTTDSINVISNGAADRGIITILGYPS
jgi:hypothetical protein